MLWLTDLFNHFKNRLFISSYPSLELFLIKNTMDISFVNLGFLSPEELSRNVASATLNLGPRSFLLHQNAETGM